MALISEFAKEGAAKEADEEASPEKSEPLPASTVESAMEPAKEAPVGESSDALVVEEEVKVVEEEEEVSPALAAGSVSAAAKEAPVGENSDVHVADSNEPVAAGAGQELYGESAPDLSPPAVAVGLAACMASAQAPAAAPVGEAASSPTGDRCKAMMEVVRKEQGKWTVSKLILEHNHPLEPPPGSSGEGLAVPAMGMEFKSAEAAKAFYYVYGELSGFKPRTGSNRRSERSGALIMQRFLCWRGNYLLYRKNSEAGGTGTRKRGPYKKRARLEEEGSAAAAAKKHSDAVVMKEEVAGEHGLWQFPSYPVFVGYAAVPFAAMNAAATGEADARAIPVPPPIHFVFPPPHPTALFTAALPLPFQQKRSGGSEGKKKQRRGKKKREKERGEKEGEEEREKRRREKERRKLRKYSNGQPAHNPQIPPP